ncbi:MAG: universal stress protein [Planctomycetota bacterium]|nr:MAG: universal stress protein [Planctomycetota bacterium]
MKSNVKVLVALDGSPESASAVERLPRILRPDGEVMCLWVLDPERLSAWEREAGHRDPRRLRSRWKTARGDLRRALGTWRRQGLRCRGEVLLGSPERVARVEADIEEPDLLVLGVAQGWRDALREALGARLPVVGFGPRLHPLRSVRGPAEVSVAVEHEGDARTAIRLLELLPAEARYRLLHVARGRPGVPPWEWSARERLADAEARDLLRCAAASFEARGAEPRLHVVHDDDVVRGLLDVLEQDLPDLFVLTSGSAPSRPASRARRLVRASPVPTLVLPPAGVARPERLPRRLLRRLLQAA